MSDWQSVLLQTPELREEDNDRTNLLDETVETLSECGKSLDEVRWVGSRDGTFAVTDQEGIRRVLDIVYDSGYGIEEIALDLVVVGDDWWLERHEYDGSEWWEFKSGPRLSSNAMSFERISRRQLGDGNYFGADMSIGGMNDDH